MKVKTSQKTVKKLIHLLETFDASTEQFLNDLPTPEKYNLLAMALVVKGEEDFEIAYEEAMHQVSAQKLTKHLMDFPDLCCHLEDAIRLKWSYFEVVWSNEPDDEEE